jgi:hypothetical protein
MTRISGLCYQRKMWAMMIQWLSSGIPSVFYGNTPEAIQTKDSIIYKSITNKIMVPTMIKGPAKIDFTIATKFRLQAGDTIYIDANTCFRLTGG